MTQTPQERQPRLEEVSGAPLTNPQSMTDYPSDNDANEKSAREKFKKTSLASLSKQTTPLQGISPSEISPSVTEPSGQSALLSSEDKANAVPRGRPVGKRALEDEDISARENPVAQEQLPNSTNGHTRKRSRDVRAGGH